MRSFWLHWRSLIMNLKWIRTLWSWVSLQLCRWRIGEEINELHFCQMSRADERKCGKSVQDVFWASDYYVAPGNFSQVKRELMVVWVSDNKSMNWKSERTGLVNGIWALNGVNKRDRKWYLRVEHLIWGYDNDYGQHRWEVKIIRVRVQETRKLQC